MHATEILSSEHRVIEQVLNSLEQFVEQGERSGTFDWTVADQMLDFLRNFADGCHHAKEEQRLFPALEQRGFSREAGPTAVMRDEHVQGRQHVAAMAAVVSAGLGGDNRQANDFAKHARRYIDLLRQHIHKEDHCLFPMADRALTEREQQMLVSEFDEVEHAPERAHQHAYYLELANTLADRFGVPRADVADAQMAACCGHHH